MPSKISPSATLLGRLARRVSQGVVGAVDALNSRSSPGPLPGLLADNVVARLPQLLRNAGPERVGEATAMIVDLTRRHPTTAQALVPHLPALATHIAPGCLPPLHQILLEALEQERAAGPALCRPLADALLALPAERHARYLELVRECLTPDWNFALLAAEQLPTLLETLPDTAIEQFLQRGEALWQERPDRARSYFKLESRAGQADIETLRQHLPLETVRRTLQLYAQAHGGPQVRIRSQLELPTPLPSTGRARALTDGAVVYLPVELSGFPTREENFRLYKAMTAIEVGRIEFGTFQWPGDDPDLSPEQARRSAIQQLQASLDTLSGGESARTLFSLLETHRVEQRIRSEYPGLVADLERLTDHGLEERPDPAALSGDAAMLEALARALWGRPLPVDALPEPVQTGLAELIPLLEGLAHPAATVLDSLAAVALVRRYLEQAVEAPREPAQSDTPNSSNDGSAPQEDAPRPPPPGGKDSGPGTSGGQARSATLRRGSPPGGSEVDPLPHQGRILLDVAESLLEEPPEADASDSPERSPAGPGDHEPGAGPDQVEFLREDPEEGPLSELLDSLEPDALGEPSGTSLVPPPDGPLAATSEARYPEWDSLIEDYKDDWCLVREERLPPEDPSFARQTLEQHGPIVKRLQREFQRIRKEALERLKRQTEGEELDVDAVVEAAVELRAGRPPSERLYIHRVKRQRDVAVAFLLDMSSSTQQVVQSSGKTVLDIEKESLILMAEALESLGDAYAIYGFSGYGRQRVSFYVAKEFAEPYDGDVRARIGGMSGRLENRDGAAIRHAVRKLQAWPARVRLLILLSDGRPLDCGCRQYFERYAQEDTRMALLEARRQGVHPFCITVDRQAQRYLSRMYGPVHFTIIDQVSRLPLRLPHIYRRLTT